MRKNTRNAILNYPRGTYDIDEKHYTKYLEILYMLESIARSCGFEMIKTSPFMYSELSQFAKAAKGKIYEIKSQKRKDIALTSDSTLSILRFYYARYYRKSKKICSNIKVFRRNKKRREFSQYCFEIVGANSPEDIEINVLLILDKIINNIKPNYKISVNDFAIWKNILLDFGDYKEVLYKIRMESDPLTYLTKTLKLPKKSIEFLKFAYFNQALTTNELIEYCQVHNLSVFLIRFKNLQERLKILGVKLDTTFNFFDFRGSEIFENRYYKCLDTSGSPFLDGGNDSEFSSKILGYPSQCGGVAIYLEAVLDNYVGKDLPKRALVKMGHIKKEDFYLMLENLRSCVSLGIEFIEDDAPYSISRSKKRAYCDSFDYFMVLGEYEMKRRTAELEDLATHDKKKLNWR